jgi:hypothetical protein
MKIGEKTITTIARLVEGLLREHIGRINQAWNNAGESDLKISLPVTLKSVKNGYIDQEVKISYVVDKVDDSAKASVNENQPDLFEEKARPCYLRPGVEVFEKVCDKCNRRIDLIFVSGTELPRIISTDEIESPDLKPGQMLQHSSCPAWADEDYKEWCDIMVAREPEAQPKLKKIAGGKR